MLSYFHRFSVFVWTSESDSNTPRVDAYFSFKTKKNNLRFQKYPNTIGHTGPHTRISTSTIEFANYTHTHVCYVNKVYAYSTGNICQERRSHLTLVPFSFPRTFFLFIIFNRIFLTLLDNVTLWV